MSTIPGSTLSNCTACGREFLKLPSQGMRKYCWECSEQKDLRRKRLHLQNVKKRQEAQLVGAEISRKEARDIGFMRPSPNLKWVVRIAVPFSYAASKNHIYALRRNGHVHLRQESVNLKAEITAKLHSALLDKKVRHNKVWIDILVQKSNHKGDAINVVDLVCDGIKRALPVDDRWFSIRSLDWEVVREGGQIYIGVGQEDVEDAQVCSYCGQIKNLVEFDKKTGSHLGYGRECRPCRVAVRVQRKERRAQAASASVAQ